VVEKDELLSAVWDGRIIEEGNLSQAVYLLRCALQQGDGGDTYIVTAPGRGYRFTAEVHRTFKPETAREANIAAKSAFGWPSPGDPDLAPYRGLRALEADSPDGTRIVTASRDRTVRVWDAATGRQVVVLNGHTDTVVSANYSSDGTRIVTAARDHTARI